MFPPRFMEKWQGFWSQISFACSNIRMVHDTCHVELNKYAHRKDVFQSKFDYAREKDDSVPESIAVFFLICQFMISHQCDQKFI